MARRTAAGGKQWAAGGGGQQTDSWREGIPTLTGGGLICHDRTCDQQGSGSIILRLTKQRVAESGREWQSVAESGKVWLKDREKRDAVGTMHMGCAGHNR